MGIRTDKGRAVSRYLTGRTGIPLLSWNGGESRIDAPPPYLIDVTTNRKLDNWHSMLRESNEHGVRACIRYDNSLPSLEEAWVGMHLRDFSVLMAAHYSTISDRIATHIKGD